MIEALQKSKLAIITSAIIGLSTVGIEPARAASFSFLFGNLAGGFLSFEDSSLTGIGKENASLYQLEDVIFEWYGNGYGLKSDDVNFSFENGYLVGVDLEGIYDSYYIPPEQCRETCSVSIEDIIVARGDRFAAVKSGSESYDNFPTSLDDCDINYDDNGRAYYICTSYLSSINYSYQVGEEGVSQLVSGSNQEYVNYIPIDEGAPSGYEFIDLPIPNSYFTAYSDLPLTTFTTIEPISGAVPEPLTVLGTGMAVGFGAFFKKKLPKLDKRDN